MANDNQIQTIPVHEEDRKRELIPSAPPANSHILPVMPNFGFPPMCHIPGGPERKMTGGQEECSFNGDFNRNSRNAPDTSMYSAINATSYNVNEKNIAEIQQKGKEQLVQQSETTEIRRQLGAIPTELQCSAQNSRLYPWTSSEGSRSLSPSESQTRIEILPSTKEGQIYPSDGHEINVAQDMRSNIRSGTSAKPLHEGYEVNRQLHKQSNVVQTQARDVHSNMAESFNPSPSTVLSPTSQDYRRLDHRVCQSFQASDQITSASTSRDVPKHDNEQGHETSAPSSNVVQSSDGESWPTAESSRVVCRSSFPSSPGILTSDFERINISYIEELLRCSRNLEISHCYKMEDLLQEDSDITEKLCRIGDSIVEKLVTWARMLPFYSDIPDHVQSQILVNKWHPLLVLITTVERALGKARKMPIPQYRVLLDDNMEVLDRYLSRMFRSSYDPSQVNDKVRGVMEKITRLMWTVMCLGLRQEEYACLQALTLLGKTLNICVL